MPTTTIYDTEGQFSWASKTTTTDESGTLISTSIAYDNGLVNSDIYANGVRATNIIEDVAVDGGLFRWSNKFTHYDMNGTVIGAGIAYDNGVSQQDTYENGALTSSMRVDQFGDAEIWESIEQVYDPSYGLTKTIVVNDDQTLQVTDYFEGDVTRIIKTDTGNVHNWVSKSEGFYDGERTMSETLFDDGVAVITHYQNGQRSTIDEFDENDARNWDNRTTSYDENGQVTQKFTEFDSGVIRVEDFLDGARTQTFQYDNPNSAGDGVMAWEHIESYFDQNGVLSERATFNDNGVLRVDSFTDGVRSQIFQYDNPNEAGDGVKSWDRIEAYYDQNGNLTENATFYDNGIFRLTTYVEGQRTSVIQEDNPNAAGDGVKSWDRIEPYFDQNCVKSEQATFYDNGILKVQSYTDGQLTGVQQSDEGDVASWDTIETLITRDGGVVEQRTLTIGDDGVERFDLREDGQRVMLVDTDNSLDGSARSWQTNERFYDENGDLAQQHIVYDDADEFVFLRVGGTLDQKVEYDGDESEAWAIRVTDYTAEGPVVVTYDTVADAPEEIGMLFFDFVLG